MDEEQDAEEPWCRREVGLFTDAIAVAVGYVGLDVPGKREDEEIGSGVPEEQECVEQLFWWWILVL